MSGVVSKTQWVGTSPHSGVVVGAPMTGFFVIDDAAYAFPFNTPQRYYNSALIDLEFTAGTQNYSAAMVNAAIPYPTYNGGSDVTLWDGYSNLGYYVDRVRAVRAREDGSQGLSNLRAAWIDLDLMSKSASANPTALNTLSLVDLDVNPLAFTTREVWFRQSTRQLSGNILRDTYVADVLASITSIRRVTSLDSVSSGTVAVPSGQQYNVSTASGGVINATAGVAQVGTLTGATLNTGSGGATVTTLTSGTIVTNGGSVTAQAGTFTGQITGNGGLTKTGTGTLFLNSANSYSGNTVINAGTVQITVGDAIGSAPVQIANNGKFKAVAGVAVTNPVVMTGTTAIYEHVLSGSDSVTNLAPVTNRVTSADIVAGDATTTTTVTSQFNANGSLSLHGLDYTKFMMVLDLPDDVPNDATASEYYLGWWDATANSGTGSWVNAVLGNHDPDGIYAGAYLGGYQKFLDDHGGWNGTTMLGAYGLDVQNKQVWAVIDHNSDFGAANNGVFIVPEPSAWALGLSGLAGCGMWMRRRTRRTAATASAR
jgi:autotransporter-associated beta strand protein